MVWFHVKGHLFCSLPNPTLLNSNRLSYIELQWPLICSLFYLRLPLSHFSCHWLRLTWPYQAFSRTLQGPVLNPCRSILLLITHVQFPSLSSCVLMNMHILCVPLWLWTQWNCINHVYWSMLMPTVSALLLHTFGPFSFTFVLSLPPLPQRSQPIMKAQCQPIRRHGDTSPPQAEETRASCFFERQATKGSLSNLL